MIYLNGCALFLNKALLIVTIGRTRSLRVLGDGQGRGRNYTKGTNCNIVFESSGQQACKPYGCCHSKHPFQMFWFVASSSLSGPVSARETVDIARTTTAAVHALELELIWFGPVRNVNSVKMITSNGNGLTGHKGRE